MNKVYLIGNLTRDPDMRATQMGVSVCNFSIAVNRRKSADGTQQTDFFNIVAWRQLADLCGKFLMKGKKVAVTGSIQTRTYEDKSGAKRTALDIVADEVEFLTPMGEAPDAGAQREAAYIRDERSAIQSEGAPPYAGFTQVDDELPF